ncbi:MAG: hypothetical protein DWQ31_17450 [Planctomycetota bacterium]|nr:MAG: hypothetical protein DWQ31_17450 [Planctomycetota bacterium]REJ92138.1 MAG: hypothetical protein DWQ35_13400 [Planctomycetota bacterium]REK28674.1 MAG: hypothetical protein DWQ42_04990 [Planctomycetota bacterium]REK39288.1 MAG: hypothetical protein DWQ46_18570 [Planctomycetota bacterium]
MHTLSVTRFGFALAMASALSYVGCVFVMMTVPKDVAINFFNSIMHGVDVTSIMRWDMPWWEMFVGVLEIFILGWLFGAIIAVFYNIGMKNKKES